MLDVLFELFLLFDEELFLSLSLFFDDLSFLDPFDLDAEDLSFLDHLSLVG